MQTIEKALHQPMPFTTGGQTITDRLNAAKHSLAGSQLGKTICKATTEELMAPKKKHLDYLLHCTNEPNVSIPQMANLLIERTQTSNWTVVYKALITIHNIMCYGNERFSQYLASCNTTFNLGNILDRTSGGSMYDMSQHVRRYGKYIGEKIATYRTCAFDFCKVKRGREDGLLRTMHTDKLLKTLPTLQNQIDALLEFQVSAGELNNGVINCSFILLFRDLIRLFACYNDGVINLLEKYFDMNKKQCREALDMYKSFLSRLDRVSDFLKVAESVGIDKGEIPDLTRAPASLLEALEAHLIHLEGGKPPAPSNPFGGAALGGSQAVNLFHQHNTQQSIPEAERTRYLELEKERYRQIEESRKRTGGGVGSNPFAQPMVAAPAPSADLLDLFNAPPPVNNQMGQMDSSNPFASFGAPPPQSNPMMYHPMPVTVMPPSSSFNTDFVQAFSTPYIPSTTNGGYSNGVNKNRSSGVNPFLSGGWGQEEETAPPVHSGDTTFNPFLTQETDELSSSAVTSQPIPIGDPNTLTIYKDTPFTHTDGSYTTPNPLHGGHHHGEIAQSHDYAGGDNKMSGDVDTALSSLAHNLDISGNAAQGKPVQWPSQGVNRPMAPHGYSQIQQNPYAVQSMMGQQMGGWNAMNAHPMYTTGGYGMQPNMGYGMQPGMGGMVPPGGMAPQQPPGPPFN